jgi:DNA-binding response OmpR family regulator
MTTPKILLVEDDQTMLNLLHTLLQLEGFDVVQLNRVNDLNDILKKIQDEHPHLILLDVHMPYIDGFELLHYIREIEEGQTAHVLMSSGMDFSERCLDEGADGFILKPYMPEDLINTIRQALADNHPSKRE